MDLMPIVIGSAIGIATGLLPGLHVNTLAALALLVGVGPDVAIALVAVGTVHTIVSILPTTYLGAPDEETALTRLPAHRMLHAGRGPEAIRVSVHASLLALVAVVALLLPYKWVLAAPLAFAPLVASWAPWLLGAVLVWLLVQEAAVDHARVPPAMMAMALAAWLGWLATTWPTRGLTTVPGSALLPLLTGLFAAPTLLAAASSQQWVPQQTPAPASLPRFVGRDGLRGVAAASVTAVLPGLTAAVATAIAHGGRNEDDPRPIIATLSAVNTAHHGFSLAALWIIGATRSGLADAIRGPLAAAPWGAGVPAPLLQVCIAMLAAGLIGVLGTKALDRPYRALVVRAPPRPLHLSVFCLIAATAWALTGPWGLALFAAATVVGHVPLAWGVRRVHLTACLIVPILVRAAV